MFEDMKNKKKLHPLEQKAKMGVLNEMKNQAMGMMGDNLKGLKKVSVMSDSPEGLHEGLRKAESLVDHQEEGSPAEEASESPEMEAKEQAEDADMDSNDQDMEEHHATEDMPSHLDAGLEHEQALSPDELDKKISDLMALKAHLFPEHK